MRVIGGGEKDVGMGCWEGVREIVVGTELHKKMSYLNRERRRLF